MELMIPPHSHLNLIDFLKNIKLELWRYLLIVRAMFNNVHVYHISFQEFCINISFSWCLCELNLFVFSTSDAISFAGYSSMRKSLFLMNVWWLGMKLKIKFLMCFGHHYPTLRNLPSVLSSYINIRMTTFSSSR